MLKITGACLILCSAAGIGASFSGDLKRRVRELRILKQLVYMLQGEIRYARLPLPEAFCHVSVRLPVPFGTFLSETAFESYASPGFVSAQKHPRIRLVISIKNIRFLCVH